MNATMKRALKKSEEDEVEMEKDEFLEEHRKLIKILRTGTREELLAEADRQEKEMEKYEAETED